MKAASPDARTVVLVHGLFDTAWIFRRMARRLRERGWTPHAVTLRPNTGRVGLDQLAQQVKGYVDAHVDPAERIHLVGFSMGGLVARYYVQRLGGGGRVHRFITLSTPHHGSRLAHLLPNEGCRQMRPGSPFLEDLNRDVEVLEPLGFTSIWTPWDLSILPATSSVLPVGRSIQVPVALHPWIVWSRRSIDEVVRLLERGA